MGDGALEPAWRQAGLLLLIGGAASAVSTALHPVTVDPLDAAAVLDAVRDAPRRWVAVHVLLGFGVAAWTLGWYAAYRALGACGRARWSGPGSMLAVAALAVWVPLLAAEAAGLPLLARATAPGTAPGWWRVAWPVVLAGGYAATWLYWLAGLAVAWDLAPRPGAPPIPVPSPPLAWSLAALLPGLPGMVLAWLWPALAVPILVATLVPGALWALVLAWRMARPPGAVGRRPRG